MARFFRLCILLVLTCCLTCSYACAAETVLAPDYPVPDYVSWLLDIARAEIGYTEGKNGYTKYGEWAGDPQAEWCAEFLCWCVDQVDQQYGTHLLTRVYPRYSGMNTGLNWFLRNGRYIARTGYVNGWGSQWYIGQEDSIASGSYVPQPGDWVFYTYDSSGNTAHVAMVEYCAVDENGEIRVHVIEGNLPDRVQRSSRTLTDWRVLGYGTVYELADLVLQSGCEGVKVQALQDKLCYLGYLDEQYATGAYGPSTAEAVRAFQTAMGKTPTGIANHHTQLSLNALYRERYWQDDANFQVSED